jgi:hypothetical protein
MCGFWEMGLKEISNTEQGVRMLDPRYWIEEVRK